MDLWLITVLLFCLAVAICIAASRAVLIDFVLTDRQQAKLMLFVVLSSLQFFLAGYTLIHEAMARSREDPMNIFPIEHVNSWPRLYTFGACAVLGVLATLAFAKVKWLTARLPAFKAIIPLAILGFVAGLFLSHYLSRQGYCCETPYTFFFGYPFSALQGIHGYEASVKAFASYGLFDLLSQPDIRLSWDIKFSRLLLDALFWLNASFVVCGVGNVLLRARHATAEEA